MRRTTTRSARTCPVTVSATSAATTARQRPNRGPNAGRRLGPGPGPTRTERPPGELRYLVARCASSLHPRGWRRRGDVVGEQSSAVLRGGEEHGDLTIRL